MVTKRTARNSGNYSTPCVSVHQRKDSPILAESEYSRGSRWATLAFIALFAFLSIGCAVWGW